MTAAGAMEKRASIYQISGFIMRKRLTYHVFARCISSIVSSHARDVFVVTKAFSYEEYVYM